VRSKVKTDPGADMRIGHLAEQSGLAPTALRYYERSGLLPAPHRTASGYRAYDVGVLSRLAFIRAAQAVGLSLAEIREVLAIRDGGNAPCEHVVDLIERHRADVVARISQLRRLEQDLAALAAHGAELDPADCDPSGICKVIPIEASRTAPAAIASAVPREPQPRAARMRTSS
jgi:MerR family transcriptional regulator, copper efflux regulator